MISNHVRHNNLKIWNNPYSSTDVRPHPLSKREKRIPVWKTSLALIKDASVGISTEWTSEPSDGRPPGFKPPTSSFDIFFSLPLSWHPDWLVQFPKWLQKIRRRGGEISTPKTNQRVRTRTLGAESLSKQNWRGNTGTLRSDRKRRMMKKTESWQIAVLASAFCHCQSNGCFTATARATKHEVCMMWLKIIIPFLCSVNNQNKGYFPP